jgi:hypothetical protein
MRRVEICGPYAALETFTDEDERREQAEAWDEVARQGTDLYWPVPRFVGFDAKK